MLSQSEMIPVVLLWFDWTNKAGLQGSHPVKNGDRLQAFITINITVLGNNSLHHSFTSAWQVESRSSFSTIRNYSPLIPWALQKEIVTILTRQCFPTFYKSWHFSFHFIFFCSRVNAVNYSGGKLKVNILNFLWLDLSLPLFCSRLYQSSTYVDVSFNAPPDQAASVTKYFGGSYFSFAVWTDFPCSLFWWLWLQKLST